MTGKNKPYLIDTNVIVRYLLGEKNELGNKAYDFFSDVQSGVKKAIILESVFTETVFILNKVYLVKKEEITSTLRGLLLYKGIVNEDKESLLEALEIFSNTKLHIVDCILISKAKNNYQIISVDRELEDAYNSNVIRN
jgi:predicted nucleic-acid-binding protein